MRKRTESGYISIFFVTMVFFVSIGIGLFARTRQQVRAAFDAERRAVSYYAAEGGLQRALAGIEAGRGSGSVSGRLGKGLYEVAVEGSGGGFRITCRGYYWPSEREKLPSVLKRLKGGGGNKTVIKVSGRIRDSRFVTESWEQIP